MPCDIVASPSPCSSQTLRSTSMRRWASGILAATAAIGRLKKTTAK